MVSAAWSHLFVMMSIPLPTLSAYCQLKNRFLCCCKTWEAANFILLFLISLQNVLRIILIIEPKPSQRMEDCFLSPPRRKGTIIKASANRAKVHYSNYHIEHRTNHKTVSWLWYHISFDCLLCKGQALRAIIHWISQTENCLSETVPSHFCIEIKLY